MSGIWVVGTMVNLDGNAGGVRFDTLGEGAGQYVCSAPAGEGCGAFGVGYIGRFSVTLEKMCEIVWMAEN